MNSKVFIICLLLVAGALGHDENHNCVNCKDCCNRKKHHCFPPDAVVYTRNGPLKMKNIELNDEVLAVNASKALVYSPVITMLDVDDDSFINYTVIETSDGHVIQLTSSHLIYRTQSPNNIFNAKKIEMPSSPVFASAVIKGDAMFVTVDGKIEAKEVMHTSIKWLKGAYAPLTKEGTVVVNGIVSSCYATINDHDLAHKVFGPLRYINDVLPSFMHKKQKKGISWYPMLLQKFGGFVLDRIDYYPVDANDE